MCPPLDKTRHNNWNRKFKAKWRNTEFEVKLKWQKLTDAFELKLICLQEERVCFGELDVKLRSKHNLCCNCKPSTSKTPMINFNTTSTTFISLWYLLLHCQQTMLLLSQLEHNIPYHHKKSNHGGITSATSCIPLLVSSLSWIPTYKGQLLPKKEWKRFHLIEELRPKQTDWAASSTFYSCFFTSLFREETFFTLFAVVCWEKDGREQLNGKSRSNQTDCCMRASLRAAHKHLKYKYNWMGNTNTIEWEIQIQWSGKYK